MSSMKTVNEKKNFSGFIITLILSLIAIVCLLSLVVFTFMLLFNQNELRILSNHLLSSGRNIIEIEANTKYVNTIHSMLTVVDHTQILALIYSLLSTICIGVGLYLLKEIRSRQKELTDKATVIEEKYNDIEERFVNIEKNTRILKKSLKLLKVNI